jgi:hypothetical protein
MPFFFFTPTFQTGTNDDKLANNFENPCQIGLLLFWPLDPYSTHSYLFNYNGCLNWECCFTHILRYPLYCLTVLPILFIDLSDLPSLVTLHFKIQRLVWRGYASFCYMSFIFTTHTSWFLVNQRYMNLKNLNFIAKISLKLVKALLKVVFIQKV